MNDYEMTIKCAEAMGWEVKPAELGPNRWRVYDEAGDPIMGIGEMWIVGRYKPLEDDAQAMALFKKMELEAFRSNENAWDVMGDVFDQDGECIAVVKAINEDLNRAIVECVAQMVAARTLAASPAVEST